MIGDACRMAAEAAIAGSTAVPQSSSFGAISPFATGLVKVGNPTPAQIPSTGGPRALYGFFSIPAISSATWAPKTTLICGSAIRGEILYHHPGNFHPAVPIRRDDWLAGAVMQDQNRVLVDPAPQ
jgi:hypothetical protein